MIKKFWNFTNVNDTTAELHIRGQIIDGQKWIYDYFEIPCTDKNLFIQELEALGDKKVINVFINSEGGDMFAGLAINNILQRHTAQVIVTIDGFAASAATIIAMAGDIIKMPSNAIFLIHNPLIGLDGYYNKDDIEKIGKNMADIQSALVKTYSRTKLSDEEIQQYLDEEKYFTAKEANEKGFIDEVLNDYSVEILNLEGFTVINSVAHKRILKEGESNMKNTNNDSVAVERERLLNIDKISSSIDADLVHDAKYVNPISAEALAFKAMTEGKVKNHLGNAILENLASGVNGVANLETPQSPTVGAKNKQSIQDKVTNFAKEENMRRMGVVTGE